MSPELRQGVHGRDRSSSVRTAGRPGSATAWRCRTSSTTAIKSLTVVAVGVSKEGVEFNALDKQPVHLDLPAPLAGRQARGSPRRDGGDLRQSQPGDSSADSSVRQRTVEDVTTLLEEADAKAAGRPLSPRHRLSLAPLCGSLWQPRRAAQRSRILCIRLDRRSAHCRGPARCPGCLRHVSSVCFDRRRHHPRIKPRACMRARPCCSWRTATRFASGCQASAGLRSMTRLVDGKSIMQMMMLAATRGHGHRDLRRSVTTRRTA